MAIKGVREQLEPSIIAVEQQLSIVFALELRQPRILSRESG